MRSMSWRCGHIARELQQAGSIANGTDGPTVLLHPKLWSCGVPSSSMGTSLWRGGEGDGSLEGQEVLQVGLREAGVHGVPKARPRLVWVCGHAVDQVVGE